MFLNRRQTIQLSKNSAEQYYVTLSTRCLLYTSDAADE